jgi:hypothetical protein
MFVKNVQSKGKRHERHTRGRHEGDTRVGVTALVASWSMGGHSPFGNSSSSTSWKFLLEASNTRPLNFNLLGKRKMGKVKPLCTQTLYCLHSRQFAIVLQVAFLVRNRHEGQERV